ncbi:uncharacterized protein SAPINGB_P005000 [Magnusiomyces paraingens]|uniref:HIT domain-containing protein n=1 Tax=Magnusiomyces paraingens TaxID=2606893 RepID=A0A5E8C598_9ASCO|nr:uncharacterized protein SAPINGB_P005000 [Saprochaete ingens]VVT56356.1 unnamed protein product [Saprochaete ingens]
MSSSSPHTHSFDPDCPFCSLANHSPPLTQNNIDVLPPNVLLSTPRVLAFLDVQPLTTSAAHILITPRAHTPTLLQLSSQDAKALGEALPAVARAAAKALGYNDQDSNDYNSSPDFNLIQNNGPGAGQTVPHVHFHLVFRKKNSSSSSSSSSSPTTGFSLDSDHTEKIAKTMLTDSNRFAKTPALRWSYAAQVFGRGQRTDLDDDWTHHIVPQLRKLIKL